MQAKSPDQQLYMSSQHQRPDVRKILDGATLNTQTKNLDELNAKRAQVL